MINILKQLIDFIKVTTNFLMKYKVFKLFYKAFIFISSLYIVKIYILFWRYIRKTWSFLSAILLLIFADFNLNNIITAFSLILSSLPNYIYTAIQNLWIYITNKIYDKPRPSIPAIPTIPEQRTKLKGMFSAPESQLEQVAMVEDREISGKNGPINVRLYTPKSEGPLPVILFFHRGGWVYGSIQESEMIHLSRDNGS